MIAEATPDDLSHEFSDGIFDCLLVAGLTCGMRLLSQVSALIDVIVSDKVINLVNPHMVAGYVYEIIACCAIRFSLRFTNDFHTYCDSRPFFILFTYFFAQLKCVYSCVK